MSPFDIVKIINNKSLEDKEEVIDFFVPWVINRAFSNTIDSVFVAKEATMMHEMPLDIQFDFYYHGVPRGKRFGKWYKFDKSEQELINRVVSVLDVHPRLAKRYLSLLSEDEKQELLNYEGGT